MGAFLCLAISFDFTPVHFFVCSETCDIVGDVSYEELRAIAYDEAKRGISLQSIVRKHVDCL